MKISSIISGVLLILMIGELGQCVYDYLNLPVVYLSNSRNECVKVESIGHLYKCENVDVTLVHYVKVIVQ
jgi:hypothetical protein